jgi:hypothetical protein
MKRLILFLAAVFAVALPAHAQTQTSVSATIVDPNGIHYAGGTVKFDLSPSTVRSPTVNQQPVFSQGPVSVDPTGHFTIGLWANSAISPGGTQWTVTVYNPGAPPPVGFGPVSFSVTLTISGSSQDISSALNAAALPLLAVGTASTSVTSFNGRMGAVLPATNDYSFSQISGSLLHSQLPTLLSADIPNNAASTSGNAATSTAFASVPTKCSAGNYPLGVDVSGNAQNCTAAPTGDTTALYIIGAPDGTLTNSVANPGLYNSADDQPAAAGTFDDEFPGSSLSGAWTAVNGATATVSHSRLQMSLAAQNVNKIVGFYEALPAGTWDGYAPVQLMGPVAASIRGGLWLRESATGKCVTFDILFSGGAVFVSTTTWTNSTTIGSNHTSLNIGASIPPLIYLRMKYDGTNLIFYSSWDGYGWVQVDSVAATTFFTTKPDGIGFENNSDYATGSQQLDSDYIRRTS